MKTKQFIIDDKVVTAHEHHTNKGFYQLVGGDPTIEIITGENGEAISSQPNAYWVSIGGYSWVTMEEILNVCDGAPYKVNYGF